ncbi:MAG: hypothetical protein Q9174_007404, partial [Haloplaca sp. 1 TL-2023]
FAASRNANTQPTYDFLSGGGAASPPRAQPLQQSFRQSQAVKPDLENENLRAKIKSLQYEVNTLKSDRDYEKTKYEEQLQGIQARADADFQKAQVLRPSNYPWTMLRLADTRDLGFGE